MRFDFKFTEEHLNLMLNGRNAQFERWFVTLEKWLPDYNITTCQRVASFVAQCAHESSDFTTLHENLNYRWETLRRVFPKYFPTDELAKKYAHNRVAIANRVYANRMGNGNEASGDGYRYCGKGLIQLTGKHNYARFSEFSGIPLDDVDEYVQTYDGAVHSACWFWHTNSLNRWADIADIATMTKRINGGDNGLADRIKRFDKNMDILGAGIAEKLTTLRKGSTGPDVINLQLKLGLIPDGIYGATTERAVRKFQSENGVDVDGIAGPVTLSLIFRD